MSVLVDSDVLIDVLSGHAVARRRLTRALKRGPVYASVITRAEILAGMRDDEQPGTLALLRTVRWLSVDLDVAERAGLMAREHRTAHPAIGLPDYLIAATAELAGLKLCTRNVRHFPMVRGLRPAY